MCFFRVIFDLRMLGRLGLELLKRFKEVLLVMEVVVFIGYGSIINVVDVMWLGVINYVIKLVDVV